jgi:hypothetical protein
VLAQSVVTAVAARTPSAGASVVPTSALASACVDRYEGLCPLALPLPLRLFRVTACEVVKSEAVVEPEAVVLEGEPALDHPRAIAPGTMVNANWKRGGMK